MKKLLIITFVILAIVGVSFGGTTEQEFLAKVAYPSVALLYTQDAEGSMKMLCTATAIERNDTGYVFATAAHCASDDDIEKKIVKAEIDNYFYITFDESTNKQFAKASIIFCGYQHAGDDFCEFQVNTKDILPVLPIGDDPKEFLGEPVVNVASPLGLGKQIFHGYVSSPKLDRDVRVDDINWTNAILLQMPGTNGGSSGSAIICLSQQKICAFLVGTIAETEIVAIPASRLTKARELFKEGKYPYWKPEVKK